MYFSYYIVPDTGFFDVIWRIEVCEFILFVLNFPWIVLVMVRVLVGLLMGAFVISMPAACYFHLPVECHVMVAVRLIEVIGRIDVRVGTRAFRVNALTGG